MSGLDWFMWGLATGVFLALLFVGVLVSLARVQRDGSITFRRSSATRDDHA